MYEEREHKPLFQIQQLMQTNSFTLYTQINTDKIDTQNILQIYMRNSMFGQFTISIAMLKIQN